MKSLRCIRIFYISFLLFLSFDLINAQQININRIEQMPNIPSPYEMRDWKNVTEGYDSLVFNINLKGTYLPLVWTDNNATNYSGPRFGLHTVVGTTSPTNVEAINCIPAVVGATIVGIDKSNQNNYNWVQMCQEWFNKNNGRMIYKNNSDDPTTDDWWYETMPNVFFYQLYYLYPNTGDFHNQFISVADQFLKSINVMGGSTTPWKLPNMNYQGFDYLSMTPYPVHDHNEPEAAGATAWILYNAYKVTGDSKYRIGAELAMEYLNSLNTNPAYELQLYYGVYLAARMNAEIGTNYDVTKMLNWCFTSDNIRNWGVMTGNWGGYDVDGLIGEINSNLSYGGNYPFTMNTFEQIGALVPMVRYDARYARAIGKLVLNAANAARLFYPNYLPSANQDPVSKTWADQYDTNSYIAHESMHQYKPNNGAVSPYATGDAVGGGWGLTNLALYGSSHVGILGGIIDTTNIEGILKLDVLKTDYFHKDAFPSFLYYNPYSLEKSVIIDVGNEARDIYDAVSSAKLKWAVTGETSIVIQADAAVIAVIIPAGSKILYDLDKAFVNGVIIDYLSGQTVANYPPRIKSLASDKQVVVFNDSAKIYCTAIDKDSDPLTYQWSVTGGSFSGTGSVINWLASSSPGTFTIACNVGDGKGGTSSDSINIEVVEFINNVPTINQINANPRKIHLGSNSTINCLASDLDGDTLNYNWSTVLGTITGNGTSITWTAPPIAGNYYISCSVNDGHGGIATDSIGVSVRDTTIQQTGELVAFYPFSGDAKDVSGFKNNGTVSGATLTTDRWGNTASAYSFDGVNDNIRILSSPSLNFQNSITINFWIKVGEFYDREQYPLSHGNYEKRWKVSISNKRIRWTIKTNVGIKDLDSETELVKNNLYNVTVLYNEDDFEIYINGELDAFSSFSGSILTTTIDLMIGQVLPNEINPNDPKYNFKGVLDDIRIYNYALSYSSIQSLYDFMTDVKEDNEIKPPKNFRLTQNYPNPFNGQTNIEFQISNQSGVKLEIFNILGQKIRTLMNEEKSPGYYKVNWNGDNDFGNTVNSGIYFIKISADKFSDIKKMTLLK
jgi:hypothetical protein